VRPPLSLTALLGLLLLTGACGVRVGTAQDEPSAGPTVTVTASPEPGRTPTQTALPDPEAGVSRSPSPGPRLPKPAPVDLSGYDMPGFTTPSGNIGCLFEDLQGAHVRCDRLEHTGELPPKPADCDFDWGHSVELSVGRRAELACTSDSVMGLQGETDGARELPYGDSVRYRGITCTSTETGLRCRTSGGHGFVLARASVRVR
jgi:hypothetical protein